MAYSTVYKYCDLVLGVRPAVFSIFIKGGVFLINTYTITVVYSAFICVNVVIINNMFCQVTGDVSTYHDGLAPS